MAELVEGARLEIVCTLTRTEGSNPSLSATKALEIGLFAYLEVKQNRLNIEFPTREADWFDMAMVQVFVVIKHPIRVIHEGVLQSVE